MGEVPSVDGAGVGRGYITVERAVANHSRAIREDRGTEVGLVCGKVYEYIVYIGIDNHLKNSNRSSPLLFFLPSFVVVLLLLLFTFYFFVVA